MAECTYEGTNSYIGFTIDKGLDCTTTDNVAAQLLIELEGASQAAAIASLMLVQKDAEEWTMEIDEFESPRTTDAAGGFVNMRFGHQIKHSRIPISFEWPWEQDFNPSLLLGTEGTFTKYGPDGSKWSGKAKVVQIPGQPALIVGEISIGQASWRWLGGTNQPSYTAPA